MSLDVYLTMPGIKVIHETGAGQIFIRDNGQTREISRAEWDERYPGKEPIICVNSAESSEVYSRNITHNLNRMADAAGIYNECWRPDEIGITHARQLIEPLREGLKRLTDDPEKFKTFNPSNGWGDYGGLIAFVREYLAACEEYPDAEVRISR